MLDMTRLLLVRHGQSQTNLDGIFAGSWDSPLTDLGVRQAELTAEHIAKHYCVDCVYASDLQRAFVTGKTVADQFGLDVTVVTGMREIHGGLWEHRPFDLLPQEFPESYGVWLQDIGNATCDGGESVSELQQRVLTALFQIAEENPEKTVVIATHGTPIRAIQCFCEGKTLNEMKDIKWVSNASITEILFENNRLQIENVSYDAHLGMLTSVLPATC